MQTSESAKLLRDKLVRKDPNYYSNLGKLGRGKKLIKNKLRKKPTNRDIKLTDIFYSGRK